MPTNKPVFSSLDIPIGDSVNYSKYNELYNINDYVFNNINDFRNTNQTTFDLIGNSLANFSGSAATSIAELGSLAYGLGKAVFYDTPDYIKDMIQGTDTAANPFATIINNDFGKYVVDPILEYVQKEYPYYATQKRIDAKEKGQSFDGLTFGEFFYDFAGGAGFSAGAWATGAGLTKIFNVINKAKTLTLAQKALVGTSMAYGESSIEGRQTIKEVKARLEQERALGKNDLSDAEIQAKSEIAGLINFGINLPIVGGTNALTFGLFKPKFNLTKNLVPNFLKTTGVGGKTVETVFNKGLVNSTKNKIIRGTSFVARHPFVVGSFSEGFQEGAQFTSNKFINDYISASVDKDKNNDLDIWNSIKSAASIFISEESRYNMLLGAAIGGVMGGGREVLSKEYQKEYKENLARIIKNDDTIVNAIKNDKELNKIVSDKLSTNLPNYNRLKNYVQQALESYRKGDLFNGNSERRKAVASWVEFHLKNNSLPWIKEYVKSFKDITNPEEVRKILGPLFDAYDHNPNNFSFKTSIDSLLKEITELEEIHESVYSTYKAPEQNTEKFKEYEGLMSILYNSAQANAGYLKRITSMQRELAVNGILFNYDAYNKLTTNRDKVKFTNDFIKDAETRIKELSKSKIMVDGEVLSDLSSKAFDLVKTVFENDVVIEAFKTVESEVPYLLTSKEIREGAVKSAADQLVEDIKKKTPPPAAPPSTASPAPGPPSSPGSPDPTPSTGPTGPTDPATPSPTNPAVGPTNPVTLATPLLLPAAPPATPSPVINNTLTAKSLEKTNNLIETDDEIKGLQDKNSFVFGDQKLTIFATTINEDKALNDPNDDIRKEAELYNKQVRQLSVESGYENYSLRFINPAKANEEEKALLRKVNMDMDTAYRNSVNNEVETLLFIVVDENKEPILTNIEGKIIYSADKEYNQTFEGQEKFTIVGSIHKESHVRKIEKTHLVWQYMKERFPYSFREITIEGLKKLMSSTDKIGSTNLSFSEIYELAVDNEKLKINKFRSDIQENLDKGIITYSKINNISNGHIVQPDTETTVFVSGANEPRVFERINEITNVILSIPLEGQQEYIHYDENGNAIPLKSGMLYLDSRTLGLIKVTPKLISEEDADIIVDLILAGIDPESGNNINGVPILYNPADTKTTEIPIINNFIKFGKAGKERSYQQNYQMYINWEKQTLYFGKNNALTFEEIDTKEGIQELKDFLVTFKRYSLPTTLVKNINSYQKINKVQKVNGKYRLVAVRVDPLNSNVGGFVKTLLQSGNLEASIKDFREIQTINRYFEYSPKINDGPIKFGEEEEKDEFENVLEYWEEDTAGLTDILFRLEDQDLDDIVDLMPDSYYDLAKDLPAEEFIFKVAELYISYAKEGIENSFTKKLKDNVVNYLALQNKGVNEQEIYEAPIQEFEKSNQQLIDEEQKQVEEKAEKVNISSAINNFLKNGFSDPFSNGDPDVENIADNQLGKFVNPTDVILDFFKDENGIYTQESLKENFSLIEDQVFISMEQFLLNFVNDSQEKIKEKLSQLYC